MLVLLTLLFCVGTLSVQALTDYGVIVGGIRVTSANYKKISSASGDVNIVRGNISFDPTTYTLTLENAYIETHEDDDSWGPSGIEMNGADPNMTGLTVKLIGKNRIVTDYISVYGYNRVRFVNGNSNNVRPVLSIKTNLDKSFASGINMDKSQSWPYMAEVVVDNCDIDIESNSYCVKGAYNPGGSPTPVEPVEVYLSVQSGGTLRAKTLSSKAQAPLFEYVRYLDYPTDDKIIMPDPNQMYFDGEISGFRSCVGAAPVYPKELRISPYMQFEDPIVKQICISNWDENSDGKLDYIEARLVTSLNQKFKGNTQIQSFNELAHFTGIETLEEDFRACSNLKAVELPAYVKYIFYIAFENTPLTSITIPGSVEEIGSFTFHGCTSLETVVIEGGGNLKTIGQYAFCSCPIKTMFLPEGLEVVEEMAFFGNRLTTLVIPSTVTEIDKDAFIQNNAVPSFFQSIIVKGDYPAEIYDQYVFGNTASNYVGYLDKNKTKIYVPSGKLARYQSAWPQYADYMAVANSYDISIAGIQLTNANVSADKPFTYSDGKTYVSGVYYDNSTSTLILDNAIIRSASAPAIENNVYYLTIKLFGENVIESKGIGIVSNGGELKFVPKTYNTYDLAAMKLTIDSDGDCISFNNYDINSNCNLSFYYGRVDLNSKNGCCIYGGAEDDYVNNFQFGQRANATFNNVKLRATAPGRTVMQSVNGYYLTDCNVVHPAGYTTPQNAMDEVRIGKWILFSDDEVEDICITNWDANHDGGLDEWEAADVETIGTHFQGNEDIESFGELDYFTGITEIPDNAFRDCSALEWISIPNNVKRIGNYAFNGTYMFCPDIPGDVEEIGDYAYCGCYWESFSLPYSLKTIGEGAFAGCLSMGGVWFNEEKQDKYQLEYIGAYAFNGLYDCYLEGPVNIIPQSVKYIGAHAFDSGSSTNEGIDWYMTVYGTKPAVIGECAFGSATYSEDSEIHVPAGRVSAYKSAWAEYKDYIVGESGPTSIANVTVGKQRSGIYTLDGRFLRKGSSTEGLAKGIYIVNGKKVAVK